MDEEGDDAVDINLFGIGQRAAEDENFEDVNMGAEGVTGINLFGIGGDEPSDEDNDAADKKNLDQLQQPGTGSDSVASSPPSTPPKAKPGEKVDTSKLDAELAKMESTDSPQSKQHATDASNEDSDASNENSDASNEDSDVSNEDSDVSNEDSDVSNEDSDASNEDSDASNEDSDASAASDADDDAATDASSASGADDDAAADTSNEDSDASAASGAESDAQEDDETIADASNEDADADAVGKSSQSESEFAEKVTRDVHADESAPQTTPISAEPVQPMTAQSVNYQQPDISELKKHPAPEKKTDVYSSIPIEKMPVTLTFETGRQKITLGELEKVKAGYTFECGNPINTPVTICANDTPIGTGELLDVDGRIGVRIIEFYNK